MKQRFDELRRSSWGMSDARQKLLVLEEMIGIADRWLTEEDAYQVRIQYMSAAVEAGARERLLVAFAWCLSRFERSPGDFSQHSLMWHYKWVLNEIWRMPEFSLEVIGRVFEDFRQKCLQYGYSLRPYYQQQVNFMLSQGMVEKAREAYKLWRAAPRDGMADCRACEQNLFGSYLFRINHLKRGLQTLKPILDGKMSCQSIPQNTYSKVIVPLLKLGEREQAAVIAKKADRDVKGPMFLEEHGTFLEYYAVTDMKKAVKIYNDTIRYGLASKVGWDKFNYLLSVRLFLREWGKKKRRKKLAESDYVTLEWLDREIAGLAEAFNRRNGNSYMDEYMKDKDKHARRLVEAYRPE
ncbi:hypothetical protein [Paenibacillus soyae]|uniref:Uncharacterized protein n=1 Tax=Paenibacillus soyae TaxID=2969249 RepID=A0A9X2MUE0_9BACL|nr:hypothetical protein [Paenibacillus soyae]MCR2805981.1 hypothetical protein [Paenibacillus soyae]